MSYMFHASDSRFETTSAWWIRKVRCWSEYSFSTLLRRIRTRMALAAFHASTTGSRGVLFFNRHSHLNKTVPYVLNKIYRLYRQLIDASDTQ